MTKWAYIALAFVLVAAAALGYGWYRGDYYRGLICDNSVYESRIAKLEADLEAQKQSTNFWRSQAITLQAAADDDDKKVDSYENEVKGDLSCAATQRDVDND